MRSVARSLASLLGCFVLATGLVACGGASTGPGGSGGSSASGGADASGGATASGGTVQTGGTTGMLITGSQIGSASGTNSTYLGRAWDDSSGTSPNGQIVIRDSTLDASIRLAAPWNISTQGRTYSAAGNRMYEYQNTAPGAAP